MEVQTTELFSSYSELQANKVLLSLVGPASGLGSLRGLLNSLPHILAKHFLKANRDNQATLQMLVKTATGSGSQ
jgi:hypothetical protein